MRLFCYHLFICLIFLQVIACGGSSERDRIAPVITLNGESTIELVLGGIYVELGATAIDDIDGEIEVILSGNVDTNTIGNYTITYTATDKSGNVSNRKRLIEVIAPPSAPVITMEADKDVIRGKLASLHAVVTDASSLDSLQLQWRQVTSESLVLIDDTTPTLKFQVPYIDDETILTFQLTAINKYGKSASKEINITVQPLFNDIKNIASDTTISELRDSTHLKHADLDSDGDEDLYVYSELNKNIVLLINDKTNFSNSSIIDTSICKQEPLIYDFDQDGNLDFICKSINNDEEIYLIRNINNTEFAEPKLIYTNPAVKHSRGMAFGDLNNDGKTDIAFTKPTHLWENVEVFALFNNGEDQLEKKVLVASIPRFDTGYAIPYIFDANGDAYLDILLTPNFDSADFRWFENKEASNFIEHILPLEGSKRYPLRLIGFKDWDSDGDIDLIVGKSSAWVFWVENLPGNDFVVHNLDGAFSTAVTITDWDGDGDYDLFVKDLSRLYENIGNSQFENHYFPENNTSAIINFNLVDVDSDGLDDIVRLDIEAQHLVKSYNKKVDALSWKKNINGTSLGLKNIIVDSYRLYGIEDLVSADFDGDGDVDIISVSYIKDRLMLHKNGGLGDFNEKESIPIGNIDNLDEIQAVDWENDGDIDLFFKYFDNGSIFNQTKLILLKNNGLGQFSLPTPLEFEADLGRLRWIADDKVIVRDLNQDKLQDIIFILDQPGTSAEIAIYTQTTQNKLRLLSTSKSVAGMSIINVANIDGDDDLDIITTGWNDISWFEFVDSQIIEQSIINAHPHYNYNVVDIDSDGDSDLVSNSKLFINNDAVFSNMERIPLFISNKNKYLDIDFDGDIDVIGARVSTEGLPIWSEAIGPFEFLQHQSASSNKEYPTTAADFDGDGDLDIALAHTDEQKIIFVKNQYIQKVSKNN